MGDHNASKTPVGDEEPVNYTRRRILQAGAAGLLTLLGAGVAGVELIEHGDLPGKTALDHILGYCSVPAPHLTYAAPGPEHSGTFFSRQRNRTVGYTIAYPPGHGPGSELPLIIALHGFGANHNMKWGAPNLADSLAAEYRGVALPPMAMVTVDGGGLYWNPHPGDNPEGMIISELIPMCQKLGLGRSRHGIGTVGISMGGFGSLLLAEQHPQLISAAAVVSPAIWTSYAQARAANSGAYASAADFRRDDVVTHASALATVPVRIASGNDDPFHPGVVALANACPPNVVVYFGPGCHGGEFLTAQAHPSLAFVGEHLS